MPSMQMIFYVLTESLMPKSEWIDKNSETKNSNGNKKKEKSFFIEKVQEFCKEFFKFHKVRTKSGEWIPFMPYDHQIESAYKILKNRYCMAEVATSGGKSLIISIVMFYTLKHIQPNAKFLII